MYQTCGRLSEESRSKRKKKEPTTAIKSKTGEVVEDPEKIRARYLEHFVEILKIKPAITEKEKNQEYMVNLTFDRIMRIAESAETILTKREEVSKAVNKLKRKKCKDKTGWNNEVILESGEDMIDSLMDMNRETWLDRYLFYFFFVSDRQVDRYMDREIYDRQFNGYEQRDMA